MDKIRQPVPVVLTGDGLSIYTLSNGKRVGNFSSPHPFTFEDGTVLPAISPAEAVRLKVDFKETSFPTDWPHTGEPGGMDGDIFLDFDLSCDVVDEMQKWIRHKEADIVDVVFVPLPMMTAMRKTFVLTTIIKWPFRVIRIVDRVKKVVSIDKQCL